jgi:hypothetical protein
MDQELRPELLIKSAVESRRKIKRGDLHARQKLAHKSRELPPRGNHTAFFSI